MENEDSDYLDWWINKAQTMCTRTDNDVHSELLSMDSNDSIIQSLQNVKMGINDSFCLDTTPIFTSTSNVPTKSSSMNSTISVSPDESYRTDALKLDNASSFLENCNLKSALIEHANNELPETLVRRHCTRRNRPKKLSRKRTINKQLWIDAAAKKARKSGTAGVGRKGIEIKAKKIREGCGPKCRLQCQKNISIEERQWAFKQFWQLCNKEKQWQCIDNWVHASEIKIDTTDTESEDLNAHQQKRIYRLPKNGISTTHVCKKMFLDTLDISIQCVKTAEKKKKSATVTGVLDGDERGKHLNRPFKVPKTLKDFARQHIASYPVMDSHYCRENSKRKYLEEGLTISLMFRQYKEESAKCNIDSVSHHLYKEIFDKEFNYSFFQPKKDRCEICEYYTNLSQNEKFENKDKQEEHILNKKLARSIMKESKELSIHDKTICTINFDMQKVLTTPRAEIGPLYYMSKLSVWNFTIFDMATHDGQCNIWNETIGCRGSTEIASFLWRYINEKVKLNVKKFLLFSDNCGGQNRNKMVFSMYVKAAIDFNVTIIHRFLEVGHTQSDGDSMHARTEKHCRNKSIFTQEEWCRLIENAKVKQQYVVNRIEQQNIFNFYDLAENFKWTGVKISNVREINVEPNKNHVSVKYDFNTESERITIFKKGITDKSIREYRLKTMYDKKIPLNEKKKKDLRTIVAKGLIPKQFETFYEEITLD